MLPLERQAGVDIPDLQNKFPEMLWIGGFDKMCMLREKSDIDAEFERLKPAIKKGRFIPSVDHQTPPGVSLANYKYYIKKLSHFGKQACKA